jgi:hypothetical protein
MPHCLVEQRPALVTLSFDAVAANGLAALRTSANRLLNATLASDTSSPGVGHAGVYSDLWGNPYIITVDLNNDNKCRGISRSGRFRGLADRILNE